MLVVFGAGTKEDEVREEYGSCCSNGTEPIYTYRIEGTVYSTARQKQRTLGCDRILIRRWHRSSLDSPAVGISAFQEGTHRISEECPFAATLLE